MKPIDVTPSHLETVQRILQEHVPELEVRAFGSRVSWTARETSDLDLVLMTAEPLDLLCEAEMRDAFDESDLPFRVDLVDWAVTSENFRKVIEREYVTIAKGKKRNESVAWPTVTLGDCAVLVRETISPSDGEDVPYVGLEHIGENTLSLLGHGTASDVTSVKACFQSGDILFGKLRPYFRKVVRAPFDGICSTDIWVVRAKERMDQGFLYYCMASQAFVDFATLGSEGTRMPRAKWEHVSRYEILLPPLPEQRAIAHILGTLDDKIELNRRTSETLEAMARTLFKSWFIDFDPVHAKATLNHHHSLLERESARQPADTHSSEAPHPSPHERESASRSTDAHSSRAPHHSPLEREPASRSTDAHSGRASHHSPLEGESARQGRSPQSRRWGVIRRGYTQRTLTTAQTLRRNRTNPEGLLWHYLRHNQLDGHRFRRQHPIGPYIVDFACLARNVLIELDGSQHADRHADDEKRSAFLRTKGYRVLRFWNNDVFENCFGVLERIYEAVTEHPPPSPPAPDGLSSPTPPQGGSDWTLERARTYLNHLDPQIAAFFPDRFVNSELGMIPEGWEIKPLTACFNLTMGQSPPGNTYNKHGKGLPFFQGRTDFGFRYPENRKFCTAPMRVAESEDTLVSVRAPVGDINMAYEKCCIGRGMAALRHKSGSSSFTYYAIGAIQRELQQYEHTGTVFGAITKGQFEGLKIVEPPSELVSSFETSALPLDKRLRLNCAESRTLAVLRNALLSKLISGEIRVSDRNICV